MQLISYTLALNYLYGFYKKTPKVISPNIVVRTALDMLGATNTRLSNKIIHVSGTNGKGSVCAYLEFFLRTAGQNTITLTSPHLNSIRERIRLNGAPLCKQLFVELLEMASPVLEHLRGTNIHPTPQTIITILALLLHEKLGCRHYGIYEVGVGGAHDSTNVFDHALVGLTRVADDHVNLFGNSINKLLLEKLGLCRRGGVLVHQVQEASLHDILCQYCVTHDITRIPVEEITTRRVDASFRRILLPGEWQIDNAALAFEMFKRMEPTFPEPEVLGRYLKIQKVIHPGRLERRHIGTRAVLLDGAHNVPAISHILNHLHKNFSINKEYIAILGFSEDKDWREIIHLIIKSKIFSTLIFTQSTRPRGVPPTLLLDYTKDLVELPVMAMNSLRYALDWVLKNTSGVIVITGSLLLVGDFDRTLHSLDLKDWAIPLEEIDPYQPWMHTL